MRAFALAACVLLFAGCASPPSQPSSSTTTGTESLAPEAGTILGELYFHSDGQRTWMDSQPNAADVDTALVSVPMQPGSASFPLTPPPAANVSTNGQAIVHIASATPVTVEQPELKVTLLVDGQPVSIAWQQGVNAQFALTIPRTLPAGAQVTIEVCLCNSTADTYVMDTSGGSTASVPGPGTAPQGGPAGAAGNLTRGEVTTRRDSSGKWIAERTDTAAVPTPTGKAVIGMTSVNGFLRQETGSAPGFAAHLAGRGDTEQQARDRLATLFVDLLVGTDGGLHLSATARTSDTGSEAWNNKEADFTLVLPTSLAMASARLETTNGAIDSTGFAVDALTTTTTNGAITATGTLSSWTASTTNGAVSGDSAAPAASGKFQLRAINGAIDVRLHQDGSHGVDAHGSTTNGDVSLRFAGAQPVGPQTRTDAHVQTQGYDSKSVQTELALSTTNGDVTGSDA